MKIYFRLLSFAKPLEKYAIPYFFFTLIYAIFHALTFVLLMPILNTLFVPSSAVEKITEMPPFELKMEFLNKFINYKLYTHFGENYDLISVLALFAGVLICFSFISNLFRYLGQLTIEDLKIKTLYRLRNSVYNNVMDLHVGFFSNERKGDIMAKITSDVGIVQFCVTNTLQVACREPFIIISFLITLVAISWELTIFAVIALPIISLTIGRIVKKLRAPAKEAQENFGVMIGVLDESLSGIKIIKAYNATGFIKDKFDAVNLKFSKLSRFMARRQQLASPTSEFLGITSAAILLLYGGKLVLAGDLSGAQFVTYLAIFTQITRPIRALSDAFANITQGIASGERVLDLLDTKNEIQEAENPIEFDDFKESIEFKNVKFAYETREVIKGINFSVKRGQTVALVGTSGGGKSTISDLIPRFYDVTDGEILIDGINIKEYKIESLRAKIGVVSQDTVLFNDTIENNLKLGKLDATEKEIETATKIANAHNFIIEGDMGYKTNIGDRGMKLSGGQRQRLSIARAVLKNPTILILDEATSALDTESEKQVQQALDSLLIGRTSVVIAHRLSTIYNADKIIVVDKGIIAEEGTHEQLINKNGVYKRLIEMQKFA